MKVDGVVVLAVAFLMVAAFILGVSVAAEAMIPEGPGVDQHFPDFWNAKCK